MTPRSMLPSGAAWLRGAGYSAKELEAFGRALALVRGGEGEDGAAEAEGVDVSDFYALLDAEDGPRICSFPGSRTNRSRPRARSTGPGILDGAWPLYCSRAVPLGVLGSGAAPRIVAEAAPLLPVYTGAIFVTIVS